ncbi:MAG: hypothetical protein AAF609_16510 [Cyanobacteria bacterium P01_C01_bin.120]
MATPILFLGILKVGAAYGILRALGRFPGRQGEKGLHQGDREAPTCHKGSSMARKKQALWSALGCS